MSELPMGFKQSNKVSEKQNMISLSVYNVGRQKCTPGYKWGPGVRDHFLIHYISSGSGTNTAAGHTFRLHSGDMFLAMPETEIFYQADERDPWTYEWVGFAGADAAALVSRTDFSSSQLVLRQLPYGAEVRKHLRRIDEAFGNTFCDAVRMTGELYLLLGILISNAARQIRLPGTAEDNISRAIEYIASRYSYSLTIGDIASYVGVSRSTLFREFREGMNISPKEYLDRYRIRRACLLLKDTNLTIASVAASVGYDNGLYFSKAFRRMTGMTPSDFRNQRAPAHGSG